MESDVTAPVVAALFGLDGFRLVAVPLRLPMSWGY